MLLTESWAKMKPLKKHLRKCGSVSQMRLSSVIDYRFARKS